MKGFCISESEGEYVFTFEGDSPEIGNYYLLEDATEGTGAQNRLFHALTMEYWKSGLSSHKGDTYSDFRDQIKLKLGKGFESFIYVDIVETKNIKKITKEIEVKTENGEKFTEEIEVEIEEISYSSLIKDVKKYKDIPENVRNDPELKNLARGRLRSWADYTLKQRRTTIDTLIIEMLSVGCNSKKFNDILKEIKYEII